jgi:hypothetical protein
MVFVLQDSTSTSPKKLSDEEEMSEDDLDGGDDSSDSVMEIDPEESEPGSSFKTIRKQKYRSSPAST